MHKGPSPRKQRQAVPPQVIDDTPPPTSPLEFRGDTDGGGSSPQPSEDLCWEFAIVRGTKTIEAIALHEQIAGSRTDSDIMVQSVKGVLGFAPRQVATKIRFACQAVAMPKLVGHVTGIEAGRARVELCLVAE